MSQFVVIGLGNFGYYLALNLARKGHEVMALDANQERVDAIRDEVAQAVVADATDPEPLRQLGLANSDAAIVCIGSDMSKSILAVMSLKEIGCKRVLAMAISEAHGRVLDKIGASNVFFPERDLAVSVAEKLHNPNMVEYLPFIEGYGIIEMSPPEEFVGKSLKELDLINRYGAQVLAIKEMVPERMNLIPTAGFVVKDSDLLILLGPNDLVEKLGKRGKRIAKEQG
ncbi:MAG: TrkA family potassium uptake protein [Deltaproteobacteria bacterium]|nr:MAG: TrkA family potassium uptake protein [Deltaproteobacteria bacterium]